MRTIVTILFIVSIILSYILELYATGPGPKNYGSYNIQWKDVSLCSTFKLRDSLKLNMTLINGLSNNAKLQISYTFLETIQLHRVKIKVFNDAKWRQALWGINIEKPCQHYVLGSLISAASKNQQCIFKKTGTSENFNADLSLINNFIGTNFYYGNYFFKTEFFAKTKIIVCMNVSNSIVRPTNQDH
ncbi:hypothetical protein evm_000508 [Chilo suppressalis]|nr:hypothetical protein evm_000508 [Chilo suppressalis]